MQWYQLKEKSAGKYRLLLSWYLYKIFGKKILYIIANLVSFLTFLFSPQLRYYSKKYFSIIKEYTYIKPTILNQFKHINEYAHSLVDKILVYSNDFNADDIVFENEQDEKRLNEDLEKKEGVFFICNHIGSIELFQIHSLKHKPDFCINVFSSSAQSHIFNSFLEKIKVNFPVVFFPVENIGIETGVQLKESLSKGNIVFIAGDRLAQNNDSKTISKKMFNHEILLPQGTFKLAKLMNVSTYFISAIKENNIYRIYLSRQNDLSEDTLTSSYVEFLEKMVKINPFQFFHFYDFFN